MNALQALIAAATLSLSSFVGAQPAADDHSSHHPAQAGSATAPQSEGDVRRVDLVQGKVTLRHGPLINLDMPAMTMVFTATDKKLLEGIKVGDKVKFTADTKDGVFLITAIERAQ